MTGRNQGFTLIELSVVLVIMGLIIGGVVVGQSLVRSSRLQAIVSDTERYRNAIQLFLEKYKELPGDFSGAESLWGSDTTCPSTVANALPKILTCNGDGNGAIGDLTGTLAGGHTAWYESYRFWQHLANAGMIPGQFNGALSSRTSGNAPDFGMNVPISTLDGDGFTILYGTQGASAGIFDATYRNAMVFGAAATKFVPTYNPAITTKEALALDMKTDDGFPGRGKVLSYTSAFAATPNCATGTDPNTATYKTASDGNLCSLIFITGY